VSVPPSQDAAAVGSGKFNLLEAKGRASFINSAFLRGRLRDLEGTILDVVGSGGIRTFSSTPAPSRFRVRELADPGFARANPEEGRSISGNLGSSEVPEVRLENASKCLAEPRGKANEVS
jgi:hypothetical protein